jgi:hypothetical protein
VRRRTLGLPSPGRVGFQNPAAARDQPFQAAGSYWLTLLYVMGYAPAIAPTPRIARRALGAAISGGRQCGPARSDVGLGSAFTRWCRLLGRLLGAQTRRSGFGQRQRKLRPACGQESCTRNSDPGTARAVADPFDLLLRRNVSPAPDQRRDLRPCAAASTRYGGLSDLSSPVIA